LSVLKKSTSPLDFEAAKEQLQQFIRTYAYRQARCSLRTWQKQNCLFKISNTRSPAAVCDKIIKSSTHCDLRLSLTMQ